MIRSPWPWAAGFTAWLALLWHLSSRVRRFPASLDFTASDKLLHFGWFFVGALFAMGWLTGIMRPRNARGRAWVAAGIMALVGAIDEFHQSQVPGRHGNDVWDWSADTLGAIAAVLAFNKLVLPRLHPARQDLQ